MTDATKTAGEIGSLEELYDVLPSLNCEPLWTMKGALTREPATKMVPALWHYDDVRDMILRAGELISAEDADRRVLGFKNPGCGDHEMVRATDTLWAAIQLVLPGEIAPAHRHTAAAIRYIIEGEGGYTTVNGRKVIMETGDFLLTPNWSWHEHGHEGSGPMIWLDGLDLPMVNTLRLVFADFGGADVADRPLPAEALRTGALRPRWAGDAADAPTLVWKLADVEATLEAHRDAEGSPFDDLIFEYRDPATNGPVMPTMSASMQMLRAGVETQAHRHTSSHVYHVVRGSGSTTISGERLEWRAGDTFALPTWAEHSHANPGGEDALLFSFSDEPAIEALGLLRAQPPGSSE
jgi:gentisate 1,2-dioxygenase